MEIDVIEITEQELNRLSAVQMQLLRSAQKSKNKLRITLKEEFALHKKMFYANGMKNSSLVNAKYTELDEAYCRDVGEIVEQLEYGLNLNTPMPDDGTADETTGYIVDYTLPYTDRYRLVRDYYLTINDPSQRLSLYSADATAKRYLGSYYSTLYDVLVAYGS